LCQRFVANLPLWKANRRIADAETSVNSNAFIMGLPKMACSLCSKCRIDTHKVKCHLPFQLARCTNRACCQSHPVEIEATRPRAKRNQNSELFFRSHEVFGCLQLCVFNPSLELSTAVKCNPALFISRTNEADSGKTQGSGPQKWEFKPIILLVLETSCSDNQHWCTSLDEIVYEDGTNRLAIRTYTNCHVVHFRAYYGENCIHLCLKDRCK
jgi:hypothetical protein